MYKKFIKRLLDFTCATILLIVLLPFYLIIGILVRVFMGSPILFGQDRIGRNEKTFRMYKFRSMTNAKDADGNLLPEAERHTKFGELLRSLSLDELPEIWSIWKGDMSFIGPRPMPLYYGPYFLESERKRHTIRGGLICPDCMLTSIVPSYEEQFEYDNYYVDHISFWLDVKIFFLTFVVLFKRVGEDYGSVDRPHLNIYRADMLKDKTE